MKNVAWNKVKVGSLCTRVTSGGTPKSTNAEYYDNGKIPWLNSKEVNFSHIYSTEKFITEKGLAESSAKWIEKNSVIVAMYGATAGQVAIAKIPLTTNQACCNLTIDDKLADYRYVYYYLWNQYQVLSGLANGGAQQNLNAQIIKEFEIQLPELSVQKSISEILFSLDEQIRINNTINHNLEEQAKAIFKSWFLDFSALDNPDFYSYEGVTCPVGWRVSYLADIADYLNGLAMQKYRPDEGDFGYPVLKIKELRQRMCDKDSERCSFHIKPEYIVHDGDVIFSWSGSLLVDFWCGGECGLNQHLFKVSSTKYDKWFYYSWTQYHLNEFIAIAADKATTMGHIKREHLQSATVLVPPADIYNEIGKLLGPIYEAITRNRIESKMLAQLRDSLLPKLMSGEIDVSEVEV